ncbi:MAG: type II secretion system F family protein [Lachnospiraceae bacterium]|nr:type II secretion system F family protein [Lachnospiraceae bacterium]MBQ6024285.1 type II secretion system F family protein [Lachnospiraceae bacterium]
MTTYKYTARNVIGKKVSGKMQANDEIDLQARLKNDNLYLETVSEVTKRASQKRIRADRISDFARSIGQLVGAGVSLVRALRIICDDETLRQKERTLYADVLKQVRTGVSLSEAMAMEGSAFPPMMINMFRSAEASGTLEATAKQMAEYYSKEYKLNKKIKSSMTYPKILGVLMVIVLIIIMGYVIPQFEDLFAQMESLPATTEILLGISDFVADKWYLLILFGVIAFIVFKLLFSIPAVHHLKDKIKLKLPKIGKLMRIIYTARFARTLASLYNAGLPIIQCLTIARDTIDNRYIEAQFESVIKDVQAGQNLSEALAKVDGFTKKLVSSVVVGEETGTLDEMLNSAADQLEYDSEMAIQGLVSMLEPAIIVVLAVLVGFIIISIIQPIYGSYDAIANATK